MAAASKSKRGSFHRQEPQIPELLVLTESVPLEYLRNRIRVHSIRLTLRGLGIFTASLLKIRDVDSAVYFVNSIEPGVRTTETVFTTFGIEQVKDTDWEHGFEVQLNFGPDGKLSLTCSRVRIHSNGHISQKIDAVLVSVEVAVYT